MGLVEGANRKMEGGQLRRCLWERVRCQLRRPDRPRARPRHKGPGGRSGFGARTGVQLGLFRMEKSKVVGLGVWSQEGGLGWHFDCTWT